jgi:hypothetical protein
MNDFLGVGWAFPVNVDARDALARTTEREVEQAIR